MLKDRAGFMLLEAILAIIIVSICLTFVAQSLLTNFRTGVRFQETARSLIVMENRLGLLFASNGSSDVLEPFAQELKAPYESFSVAAHTESVSQNLKKVTLSVFWPRGRKPGQLDVTTMIFVPDEQQNNS